MQDSLLNIRSVFEMQKLRYGIMGNLIKFKDSKYIYVYLLVKWLKDANQKMQDSLPNIGSVFKMQKLIYGITGNLIKFKRITIIWKVGKIIEFGNYWLKKLFREKGKMAENVQLFSALFILFLYCLRLPLTVMSCLQG